MRAVFAILSLLTLALFEMGCGRNCTPEHPCCEAGKPCECGPNVESCQIECAGLSDCSPVCAAQFKTCDVDCGNAKCSATCSNGDNCTTYCGDHCAQSCSSAGGCKTECGDDCNYDCRSVSSCEVKAGKDSVIHCESVGSCKAVCRGNCKVECPMSGSCDLQCEADDGTLSESTSCGPTSRACGPC